MQKRRTHHFKITLRIALCASGLLLGALALFGKHFAGESFGLLVNVIFSLFALAAASFLLFSFAPYFRGDKRWYSISALLTVAFFIGSAMIWQMPTAGAML